VVKRTLDYGRHTPLSGVFGRPRNLAWPVHAYRITMPATARREFGGLNPFETVILKLIEAGGGQDLTLLSEETCIPLDLVRSVLLRLRDKDLIDANNQLVGRPQPRPENALHDDVYTSAFVFRELVGGKILPFVHVLDSSSPIKTKDINPNARTLRIEPSARSLGAPSARAVVEAIRQMQKRASEHGQFTRIPTIEQIRVGREPEEYLLDCRIAVQTRDADFRIADPFGMGFSRALEGVFAFRLQTDESLQHWMTNWLENLTNPNLTEHKTPATREVFDTPSNRRRYPNLVQALTPARGSRHRSVTDIYAALEWALFYTCETHNPLIALHQLEAEAGQKFSLRMSELAVTIGFEGHEYGFCSVPRGRIDDYRNGKAEMNTVIAIALLQAEVDEEHPMRTLARTQPHFLVDIRKLRSDRGLRAHGAGVSLNSNDELSSDAMMREVVSTLLPLVRFDTRTSDAPAESHADLLLDARRSLLGTFGYRLFNKLGPDSQNSLIEAEKVLLAADEGDNARELLLYLSAALQGTLRRFLGGVTPVGLVDSDYVMVACDRARNAGLGDLPRGMQTVNARRIRESLQGKDRTLGASVFVLLLTSSESRLADIARRQPTFLLDVDTIQERRGHGNEPVPMSKAEAWHLRRAAVITLETLLDIAEED